MVADDGKEGHRGWNRAAEPGFFWVSRSPSSEVVASLEGRFPDIIQIPAAVLEEASWGWEKTTVLARIFGRWIPPDAIIREFRRAGVPRDIVPVSLAHRCHIYRFDDPMAQAMMMGRPWVANGQPIAIEGWHPEFIPAADAVASALI